MQVHPDSQSRLVLGSACVVEGPRYVETDRPMVEGHGAGGRAGGVNQLRRAGVARSRGIKESREQPVAGVVVRGKARSRTRCRRWVCVAAWCSTRRVMSEWFGNVPRRLEEADAGAGGPGSCKHPVWGVLLAGRLGLAHRRGRWQRYQHERYVIPGADPQRCRTRTR